MCTQICCCINCYIVASNVNVDAYPPTFAPIPQTRQKKTVFSRGSEQQRHRPLCSEATHKYLEIPRLTKRTTRARP